jgi:hypothetical protein
MLHKPSECPSQLNFGSQPKQTMDSTSNKEDSAFFFQVNGNKHKQ